LGLDFAFTSRSLQQKLIEVERLSQEKQQILTTQKGVLEQQVTKRTAGLNLSLQDKAAQVQLVQREKMASMGELTAGVAHEIQNPLNFVKNFQKPMWSYLRKPRQN
jgi:two-component system, NtrC family, sensor kinase